MTQIKITEWDRWASARAGVGAGAWSWSRAGVWAGAEASARNYKLLEIGELIHDSN